MRSHHLATLLLLCSTLAVAQEKEKAKRVGTPPPTDPPLISAPIGTLPEGIEGIDFFLLIGQSNMKGRGHMPENAKNDPMIRMMHLRDDQWYRARHPLHLTGDPKTFEGHDNAGVGPGLAFAEVIAKATPNRIIALIPCARGGSAIKLWGSDGPLYENAIRRARLALEKAPEGSARFRGALWLQGEADSKPDRLPLYEDALNDLVDRLRSDLEEPALPFLAATIGELREDTPESQRSKVNLILLDLPNKRPHTACVDARDLKGHIGDTVHYDTATQEEIGRRFASLLTEIEAAGE